MSREADLYKDKIEVSLDGRQIFYLFFGGAVIVGLVFVLGVMVGRRVEARGHVDRARVAATVDPLAALDRLEGGSGLSFQGALRGAEGPVSDVEKTIAAMPKKDDKAKKDEPKAEVKKDEPKVELKKDEAKAEAKKDDAKVEAKKDEPKADVKVEAKKDAPKADVKVDAKKDEPKADAKKDEPKVDAKKDEPKIEAKKDEKPKYTLQLSSFQDKGEATAFLDSVKGSGIAAHMVEGSVDGKKYFRVRTGSYQTLDSANQARAELEKSTKKSIIVIKL